MKYQFISQLKNIDKVYDLLALCCSYVLNQIDEEPYEFGLFKDEDYDAVHDAIESYCLEKFEKGHRTAFGELRDYIIDFMASEVTIEKCFAIIKFIDDLIEVEISDSFLGGNHVVKYEALNEQYFDKVKIIPKKIESIYDRGDIKSKVVNVDCYSMLRKRRECACSILDRETANYKIWDVEHIKKYPTKIYHLDGGHPVVKHFHEESKIIFGIVPFVSKPLEQVLDIKFKGRTFYIESMDTNIEKELRQRYETIYYKSKKEGIDFLIFPELMMTENILSFSEKEEKVTTPRFIINGSIWKNFSNRSIVTDGNGKEIFSYYKKEPFKWEKDGIEYKEYLDHKNKDYVIMEIEGIGRIGVGICKDLISEEVKMFHKCIGTDILFIPAYTKSGDMLASAEGLSKEYNCIVIVANACSAFEKEVLENGSKMIGFVTMPAKNGSARAVVLREYNACKCYKECVSGCVGKKICIDFLNTELYKTGLSYKIEEGLF